MLQAFTFGGNHTTSEGHSLGQYYCVLESDFSGARQIMHDVRGPKWSMQYDYDDKFKADIAKYNLVEISINDLVLPEGMK